MKVYVITNPENGWDCVCGVYSTPEKVIEFLNGQDLEYFDEDSSEFGGRLIKDFTGMSIDEMDEFLVDNDISLIIHTEILD